MKSTFTALVLGIALGVFSLVSSGCYTQLASTHEDENTENDDRGSQYQDRDDNYSENNDQYDRDYDNEDWHHHTNLGFMYYYPSNSTYWPSSYFSAAYADPWYFGLSYGYSSYYPNYYSSSHYPYYPSCYPYYSSYYPSYYGSYPYPYSYYHPTVRSFGTTRVRTGSRPVNGGRDYTPVDQTFQNGGIGTLPTGASLRGGASQPAQRSNDVNAAPRSNGNSRVTTHSRNQGSYDRRYRDVRGTGSRGSMDHGSSSRDTRPAYHPGEGGSSSTTSSHQPSHRETGNYTSPQHGSRDIGAPRTSAPPSGRSAPPPPSRGSSTRGARP